MPRSGNENTLRLEVLRAQALREDLHAVAVVKGYAVSQYIGSDVQRLADGYLMDATLQVASATMVLGVLVVVPK